MKITDEKNLMLGKNSDIGSNFSFGYNVVIEDGAIIGNNVSIDHGSIIRRGVCIGDNTIIGANVILGEKTASRMIDSELPAMNLKIGSNSIIRSGSILYEGSTIGDNFQSGHNIVIREGTIIGHHSKQQRSTRVIHDSRRFCMDFSDGRIYKRSNAAIRQFKRSACSFFCVGMCLLDGDCRA